MWRSCRPQIEEVLRALWEILTSDYRTCLYILKRRQDDSWRVVESTHAESPCDKLFVELEGPGGPGHIPAFVEPVLRQLYVRCICTAWARWRH